MPLVPTSVAQRPLSVRSAVTNGTRLLDGVDGRSARARRFRDLVLSYSAEIEGADALTEVERMMVRQAATVTIQCEALQARIVNGEVVDHDELIRLSNTANRIMAGLRRRSPPPAPQLSDYLSQRDEVA